MYLNSTSFLVPQMFDQSTQEQCAMMVGMYFMQDQPHRLLQPRLFSLPPLLKTSLLISRRSSYLSGEMLIMLHPYHHCLSLFEAAIPKYHWVVYKLQKYSFHSPGGWKSKTRVLSGLDEALLLSPQFLAMFSHGEKV